jgi:two-component system alkaline phosphatase synthesis response regulator PhoP
MLRTFVKTSLVRDGYTCAEAPDASESVRLAKSMRPDVVILDVMMPGGSGLDVLAELRRDPDLARTPVVLITAAARTFESLRAQDYGAERCLIKPFRHAQLRSAVEAALAR